MEKIDLTPINGFSDALKVRDIRNQGRTKMTNHTSFIGFIDQLKWYFLTYRKEHDNKKLFCYLMKVDERNVGFGLIIKREGLFWITGGISDNFRGKGYGKKLFTEIVKKVPSSEVCLEVLEANIPAKKIYTKLGFRKTKEIKRNGKNIIIMKLKK